MLLVWGLVFKMYYLKVLKKNQTFVVTLKDVQPAAESFLALVKQNVYVVLPGEHETQKIMYSVLESRPGVYITQNEFEAFQLKLNAIQLALQNRLSEKIAKEGNGGAITLEALDQINLVYGIVHTASAPLALGLQHHASLKKLRTESRNTSALIAPLAVKEPFTTLQGLKLFNMNVGVIQGKRAQESSLFAHLNVGDWFIESVMGNSENAVLDSKNKRFHNTYSSVMFGRDFNTTSFGIKHISFEDSRCLTAMYGELELPLTHQLSVKGSTHVGVQDTMQTYADLYLGASIKSVPNNSLSFGVLVVPQGIEAQLSVCVEF